MLVVFGGHFFTVDALRMHTSACAAMRHCEIILDSLGAGGVPHGQGVSAVPLQ
jgi:hypothetical protein